MSKQEKPKLSKERKQLVVLGGLVGFLVLIAAYNFLGSGASPVPPPKQSSKSAKPGAAKQPAAGAGQQNVRVADATFGPLEVLPLFTAPAGGEVHPVRNVFDYPPPPPPPVPRKPPVVGPDPLPTINLGSVSPGQAIAGTSRPIPVTLGGTLFPADAQVFLNGQPIPAQRVSASVIRATIPPAAIASPGAIRFEVKSASQPTRLWSGPVSFQLTPSPDPSETFTYSGRVGAQAVLTFKEAGKRPKLVAVGETVNGAVPWKVLAINDRQVELLDTRNEIRKSLALAAKSR